MAGIKFHGAIDVVISRQPHLPLRQLGGIWLDWMAQGAQVTGNLLHDNQRPGHVHRGGPRPVPGGQQHLPVAQHAAHRQSQGGAYAHNLIAGRLHMIRFDGRMTPFHKAHSTEVAGLHDNPCGDVRYYNNLFAQRGNLSPYDKATLPVWMAGNVFLKGAKPSKHEAAPLVKPDFDPQLKLIEKPDGWYLEIALDQAWAHRADAQARDHRTARQGEHPGPAI